MIQDYDIPNQLLCAGLATYCAAKDRLGKVKTIGHLREISLDYPGLQENGNRQHAHKLDLVLFYINHLDVQNHEIQVAEIKHVRKHIELVTIEMPNDYQSTSAYSLIDSFLRGYRLGEKLDPQHTKALMAAHKALLYGQTLLFEEANALLFNDSC